MCAAPRRSPCLTHRGARGRCSARRGSGCGADVGAPLSPLPPRPRRARQRSPPSPLLGETGGQGRCWASTGGRARGHRAPPPPRRAARSGCRSPRPRARGSAGSGPRGTGGREPAAPAVAAFAGLCQASPRRSRWGERRRQLPPGGAAGRRAPGRAGVGGEAATGQRWAAGRTELGPPDGAGARGW